MTEEQAKVAAEKILSVLADSKDAQRRYSQQLHDLVLFGTSTPHFYKPFRWWHRAWWRVLHVRNRFRDAWWLVLIGRKDVCDPCEF